MRLLIDAHLDLAWNALSFNRDQTRTISEIRSAEAHMTDEPSRGNVTVSFPELRACGAAVCVATVLARSGLEQSPQTSYKRTDLEHRCPAIAHAVGRGQMAYYRLLEKQNEVRVLETRTALDEHWQLWQQANENDWPKLPVGLILSMEGADPIVTPDETKEWFELGLRAIGPAHYGQSHYAGGTGCDSGLTEMGRDLLNQMKQLGMLLDVTHLCDRAMDEAFDLYDGPLLASHHNCRALVGHDRQLTDDQIRHLIERDAVIGAAFDNWMLYRPGWVRGKSKASELTIDSVADHVDHICQMAGNTRHSAIGTDLDGGFGTEQTPGDLRTIADLHRLNEILGQRGYSDPDMDAIFHGNWLRVFRESLPQ